MKVGIFDSGVGGLTIVKDIISSVAGVDIRYVADAKNAPYGDKNQIEIIMHTMSVVEYLIRVHSVNIIIIACNTATNYSIEYARQKYPYITFIGTEPGIKPGVLKTKNGNLGILATSATIKAEKYKTLVKNVIKDNKIKLYEQSCPGLVEKIENGDIEEDTTKDMLEGWLLPMKKAGVDTIILGCTHYPILSKTIEEIMGNEVNIIKTGEAIARRLISLKSGYIKEKTKKTTLTVYATKEINEKVVADLVGYTKINIININEAKREFLLKKIRL